MTYKIALKYEHSCQTQDRKINLGTGLDPGGTPPLFVQLIVSTDGSNPMKFHDLEILFLQ